MTLRKALTQEKPSFLCKFKGSPSTNTSWPKVEMNQIVSWDAFNLENLNTSYGHILDSPIPEGQLSVPKPDSMLSSVQEITNSSDIRYLIQWSDRVLRLTFDFARKKLEIKPGTAVRSDFTPPEITHMRPSLANKTRNGRIKADHLIQLDDLHMPMLVLGLGRSSRQFPGRSLVDNPTTGTLWVVRQLANLCAHSKTRYGYILTDEDFVACCFSVKNVVNGVSEWTVAVKAVPWTKAGDTELTTDLALWWLCMLAVSGSRNRRLVAEEDTIGIDQWDEYLVGDSGGWVRRHHYSLLEEAIDPPAPPAYRSPSPSDADTVDADFNDNAESALEHSEEAGFDLNEEPMLTFLPELDNDWNNWFQINVLQRDSEE